MSNETLINSVKTIGAWARGNKHVTIAHWFTSRPMNINTAISRCWGRVTILDNIQTPDGALHCPECENALNMERLVEQLR